MHTYTDLRRLYDFCALSGLCVRVQILRSKRLVRTNTSFARKAAYAHEYGFSVLLHRLGESFDVLMMLVDSFDVAMTAMLDVIQFV